MLFDVKFDEDENGNKIKLDKTKACLFIDPTTQAWGINAPQIRLGRIYLGYEPFLKTICITDHGAGAIKRIPQFESVAPFLSSYDAVARSKPMELLAQLECRLAEIASFPAQIKEKPCYETFWDTPQSTPR